MSGSNASKGIFCLEIGEWSGDLKKRDTVEPILVLLRQLCDVPYIHRDVSTKDELLFYLRKWPQRAYRDYPVLYLAFHGVTGAILAAKVSGRTEEISMAELVEALRGKCHRRIIHFGACNVLNVHGHTINKFLRDTGALAVCGYAKDIDWLHSSVLDLLTFAAMQENQFTIPGARAIKRRIARECSRMERQLKFRMVIRKNG